MLVDTVHGPAKMDAAEVAILPEGGCSGEDNTHARDSAHLTDDAWSGCRGSCRVLGFEVRVVCGKLTRLMGVSATCMCDPAQGYQEQLRRSTLFLGHDDTPPLSQLGMEPECPNKKHVFPGSFNVDQSRVSSHNPESPDSER